MNQTLPWLITSIYSQRSFLTLICFNILKTRRVSVFFLFLFFVCFTLLRKKNIDKNMFSFCSQYWIKYCSQYLIPWKAACGPVQEKNKISESSMISEKKAEPKTESEMRSRVLDILKVKCLCSSKILCWNTNPQSDCIRRWDLLKVIASWGQNLYAWVYCLGEEALERPLLHPPSEDRARRPCLWTRKWALIRH